MTDPRVIEILRRMLAGEDGMDTLELLFKLSAQPEPGKEKPTPVEEAFREWWEKHGAYNPRWEACKAASMAWKAAIASATYTKTSNS